jgi:hypothetical protein
MVNVEDRLPPVHSSLIIAAFLAIGVYLWFHGSERKEIGR